MISITNCCKEHVDRNFNECTIDNYADYNSSHSTKGNGDNGRQDIHIDGKGQYGGIGKKQRKQHPKKTKTRKRQKIKKKI